MDATAVTFIALVVFLALLIYLKVPGMLGGALDKRADQIKTELEEARRLREEAQSLLAEYQRKRRGAEREAEAIVSQAKADAESMLSEATAALDEMVVRREKAAEQRIAQAEATAVADVRNAAVDAAIAAARGLLADSAGGKGGDDLFKKSLADIKTHLN
ncbi:MAG: F0F1 ATP synthase subunit B [Pseudomonadota bacterium]